MIQLFFTERIEAVWVDKERAQLVAFLEDGPLSVRGCLRVCGAFIMLQGLTGAQDIEGDARERFVRLLASKRASLR